MVATLQEKNSSTLTSSTWLVRWDRMQVYVLFSMAVHRVQLVYLNNVSCFWNYFSKSVSVTAVIEVSRDFKMSGKNELFKDRVSASREHSLWRSGWSVVCAYRNIMKVYALRLSLLFLWSSKALPKAWTYFWHTQNKSASPVVIESSRACKLSTHLSFPSSSPILRRFHHGNSDGARHLLMGSFECARV